MITNDPGKLSEFFMSTSMHLVTIGIFLTITKITIWRDMPLVNKCMILGVLYWIYVAIVAPGVDPMTRQILGLPPETQAVESGNANTETRHSF